MAAEPHIPRCVVAKIEHHKGELFPRVGFILTNLRRLAPLREKLIKLGAKVVTPGT